ncbi:1-acyl-sn-glycerol-3-phosphate acyltransferase [bacterium]|nr:1-acyl-sn-glycerol-3-phosphate acyltransferase [bacterium]
MQRKRIGVLILLVLIAAAALISFFRVTWQEDLFNDLPTSRRELNLTRQWLQALAGNEPVVITVDAKAAVDPSATAIRAAEHLAKYLMASKLFKQVNTGLSMEQGQKLWELTVQRLPYLLTPEDYPAIEEKIRRSPARLTALKQQIHNPLAFGITRTLQHDPLNLAELVLRRLRHFSNYNVTVFQGRFFSQDRTQLLMTAWPKTPPSDTGKSEQLMTVMAQSTAGVRQVMGQPDLQFHVIGPHRAYLDNARQIKYDIRLTLFLSMAAIVLLTLMTVRRPWLVPLALLPSAVGLAVAIIVVGFFFKQFSLIVLGISSALMGITVDYGLHLFHAMETSALPPKQAARKIRTPVLVAGLTTACAFLALLVTNLPGQYRIALFTCMGVFGAMIFALAGLPIIFPEKKGHARKAWLDLDKVMAGIEHWRRDHRGWIFLGLLIVWGMSLFQLSHLKFTGDPQALNALSPQTLAAEKHLSQTFGDPGGRILAFQSGQDEETVLQAAEEMDAWLEDTANAPQYAGRSLAVFLPSKKTQRENRHAFEKAFGTQGRKILHALEKAGQHQGFKSGAFKHFQKSLADPGAPLTLRDIRNAGLTLFLVGRVFQATDQSLTLITPIKPSDSRAAARLETELPAQAALTELVDMQHLAGAILEIVKTDFKPLMVVAFLIVGLIIALAKGRLEPVVVVLPPIMLAVGMTYGTLAWLGLEINIINMVALPFIIGLGIDYALFCWESTLARYRSQHFPDGSILLAAATTMAAFGMLAIAGHPVLHTVGLSVLLGVFYALLNSLFLVPMLMGIFLPQRREVPPRTVRTILGGLLIYTYIFSGILVYLVLVHPLQWVFFKKNKGYFARRYLRLVNLALMRTFPYGKRIFCDVAEFHSCGPAILIANHSSQIDIVLMLCLANQSMLVKQWVWRNPILGPLVRNAGFILVTGGNTESVLEDARQLLKQGISVMFFPEGTRSRDGVVRRFHKGAFQLAQETGIKVQPVALLDTRSGIRDSTWVVGPHCILIKGLDPMDPQDYSGDDAVRDMARAARQKIDHAMTAYHYLTALPEIIRQKIQERFAYQGPMVEHYIYWKLKLDKVYEQVNALLPKTGTIVDMGCGMGLMLHWAAIAERNRELIGLDDDAGKIAAARATARYQPNMTFIQADILSATPQLARTVLLLDVLHYWSVDMQKKLLQRAADWLAPGGSLIVRDGCRNRQLHHAVSWGERFTTWIGFNQKREGLYFHDQAGWKKLFEEAGLIQIESSLCRAGKSNTLFVLKKNAR